MEAQINANLTAADTIHPCYKRDNSAYKMKYTPSIVCVLICILLALLSVITMCGNLLVTISIIYFKQLHTPTNYLILSVAVADLLIGIIVCPFNIAFPPIKCRYYFSAFCKVQENIHRSFSTCSLLNLGCISIDRYYAVCHPLTYRTKMSRRVVAIMILVSWGFPAVTGITDLYVHFANESCNDGCKIFLIILLVVIAFLPLIIMTCILCIYLKIFIVAQRQVRSIQNTTCQSTKSVATVSKMERKATKTLAVVLGVYLLCWIPYFLCAFTELVTFTLILAPMHVKDTLVWITVSNSMLNPFIYAFFYSWFRSAIRMIISGKIFQGDFTNSQLH